MYSGLISDVNYTLIGLFPPFWLGCAGIKDSVSYLFPQAKHFVSPVETLCFAYGNTLFLQKV